MTLVQRRGTPRRARPRSPSGCQATGSAVSAPATLTSTRRSSRDARRVGALLAQRLERRGRERLEAGGQRRRERAVERALRRSPGAARARPPRPIPYADSTPASG